MATIANKREQNEWIKRLARIGFVANGIVYGTIGILALQAAFRSGGATTGREGAIRQIGQEPFGMVLLVIIAIGLLGYAVWRWVQAYKDPDNKGSDLSGIASRVGYFISGIIAAGLAIVAIQILTGSGGGGGGGSNTQRWTATLLQETWGRWLVGLGGLIVIGVGLYQLYKAYSMKFREKFNMNEMSATEREWAINFGRAGIVARAVVFMIVGGFFVQAAWQADASEAGGLAEALSELASQPYGPWLLGLVAIGLICYGLYDILVLARYRDFKGL